MLRKVKYNKEKKMDEMDKVNEILDDLKNEGYKSFEDRERKRQSERAMADYDRYLTSPGY